MPRKLNPLEIEAQAIMDAEYPITAVFWQRIKPGRADDTVRCYFYTIRVTPFGYVQDNSRRERFFDTLREAITHNSRLALMEANLRAALDSLICLPPDKLAFLQTQYAVLIDIFPHRIWSRVLHVMQIMVIVYGLPQPIVEEMLPHVLP